MKVMTVLLGLGLAMACQAQEPETQPEMKQEAVLKVSKTDQEWKKQLSPEQFYILREAGTERPFTGEYNMHFEEGVYRCAACNAPLFSSDDKFESHCGWPSFDKALSQNTVIERLDKSHGMTRTEILCASCGGHLGHVFNDGPTETGMRYCINSVALDFDKEKKKEEQ